jgi:NADP-dependent 3-hydroxy acid dehydrogenase YdfG
MFEDDCLAGRNALVTGASSGIGRVVARELARYGAAVAVTARREEALASVNDEIEAEFGADALALPADIREDDEVAEVVRATVERFGGLDLLVNNAGTLVGSEDIEAVSTAAYRRLMETNVDGTFFATRAAIPHLRESAGNVVFVGSFAGNFPRPAVSLYSTSKWWLRGFATNLSASEGRHGVGVTLVNPTTVRTSMVPPFGNPEEKRLDELHDPGEAAEPEELADAVIFAANQRPATTVTEMNVYMRDWYANYFESGYFEGFE